MAQYKATEKKYALQKQISQGVWDNVETATYRNYIMRAYKSLELDEKPNYRVVIIGTAVIEEYGKPKETERQELARRLIAFRRANGVLSRHLAAALGVNLNTYNQLEILSAFASTEQEIKGYLGIMRGYESLGVLSQLVHRAKQREKANRKNMQVSPIIGEEK